MPTKPTGRPRGRPPGSKNIPKIEEFVATSLSETIAAPATPPKARKLCAPWCDMTPEERSAYARALVSKRKQHRGSRPPGIPRNMTTAEFNAALDAQQPIIARIMQKMSDNGQLPDDPMAVEALQQAMTVLRSPITPKDKIAAARLVLDFTKVKPTAKVEHTIRSAEDILDEMADDPE